MLAWSSRGYSMYVVLIEKGEAFSVCTDRLFEYLERKVKGELVSIADFGVGIGPALTDVTEFTQVEAVLALRQLEEDMGFGVAAVA